MLCVIVCVFFFFNDTATTEIYTLSLHDALPIFISKGIWNCSYTNQIPKEREIHVWRCDSRKVTSHEYFHVYAGGHVINSRIYGPTVKTDAPAQGPLWLSEGVAEFAANLIAHNSGWLDFKEQMMFKMLDSKTVTSKPPDNISIRNAITYDDRTELKTKPFYRTLIYYHGSDRKSVV